MILKTIIIPDSSSRTVDGGGLGEFLDRWHSVGLIIRPVTLTASVLIDGKPLLDGIPLVQAAWAGASPEVMVLTTWPAARIEDFEARYKDLILRPKTAGEEVSQALAKDSFEVYETGTFPVQGGWRAPGLQMADSAAGMSADSTKSVSLLEREREKRRATESILSGRTDESGQTKPSNDAQTVLETGKAAVDESDSATGLRSLLIQTDTKEELIVLKRLSLPARVPFGVSQGNFAIGANEIIVQNQMISRSRLVDEQRREREGEGADREEDRVKDRATNTAGAADRTAGPRDSSPGTAKMMSASPVGNFYIYSFDGKLLQVYDVYGSLLKDYIYMGDRLIAEYDYAGARYLYYTPDQINTTRVVTDGVGNVVYSAVYDPYGGIQQNPVSTYDPQLKFSGKERDTESQLDYFGARYYDRSQYRFISADPKMNPRGGNSNPQLRNLFIYCRNSPITFLDPDGAASFRINFDVVYVKNGQDGVGIYGWARPSPNYTLSISPGRNSLDVQMSIKIEILNRKNPKWYMPYRTATPLFAELHEERHLKEIEAYVQKRIGELEPLWTEKGYSEKQIAREVEKLIDEGAKATRDKWDLWPGAILDWFQSWYIRFRCPFGDPFRTSADNTKK